MYTNSKTMLITKKKSSFHYKATKAITKAAGKKTMIIKKYKIYY